MKAIVNILKGGRAKETVAYLLDPNAKAKRELMPAKMMTGSDLLVQVGERVAKVFGDGIDPHVLTKRNEKLIVSQLEARPSTLRRRGRGTRHVVISAEFDEGEELSDDEINEKLQIAAEDFVDRYCPGSKFIGVIHRDSSQPHVHLEIENYDCSISISGDEPKRLDWMPVDVHEMQSMEWTDEFEMGKGSTKNRDKKMAADIATDGKPMLGKKKQDQELGLEVLIRLNDLTLRGEELVDAIEKLSCNGFAVNRFSKLGALLKRPSVSYGGTTVRFSRLEDHLDDLLAHVNDMRTDAPEKQDVKDEPPAAPILERKNGKPSKSTRTKMSEEDLEI